MDIWQEIRNDQEGGAKRLVSEYGDRVVGMNWKHPKWPGVIQRKEAWAWIFIFVAYTLLMFFQETH